MRMSDTKPNRTPKATVVCLHDLPPMVESIARDLLQHAEGIEILSSDALHGHDVLVVMEPPEDIDGGGYRAPSAGIVVMEQQGQSCAIYRRVPEDLSLEPSTQQALQKAIQLASTR